MSPSAPLADRIGQPLPDVTLLDSEGTPFPFRGRGAPLVLFFYIRNGTPG